ncbi:hypothetical protein MPER_08452 [Moniliophthora perniciosa FA553]|nr:hypothetical protein MPER_08452 [Moniliophthora perniciosa FA553]
MRKLDINEDTFQKLLDWFEHQNDSESDDESEDVDIGAAKKAKKAEVRTEATSCPNKSSPAKDSEKPTRISVKKPTMGLKQKQEPAIKPSISSRSGKGGSASNSGKHLSVSATKHSGKTAEAPRSTLKHRESVNNTATVTKPKKATLNHVSSDSTGSEGLKDALNQAIQSASTFSTSRKSNRSDAASSMRSNHISPQHKQVVRFEEQESDEYDEEDLQDTRKDSCREMRVLRLSSQNMMSKVK